MSKHWLDSLTVRATLVQIVPILKLVLTAFGVEIKDEETDAVVDAVCGVIAGIAAVVAVIGRWRADKPLTTRTDGV